MKGDKSEHSEKLILAVTVAAIGFGVAGLVGCEKKSQPAPADVNKVPAKAASAAAVEQTVCPVTGEKIDKNVFVEYKGKKVYFCMESCKTAFEKNPEKYIAKLPQFAK